MISLKKGIILILALAALVIMLAQIDAERYISSRKSEPYGLERERLSHSLAIISYMNYSLKRNKGDIDIGASFMIYDDLELNSYKSSLMRDTYVVKCFYTREERVNYICTKNLRYVSSFEGFEIDCPE
jgi:hypothetical protein